MQKKTSLFFMALCLAASFCKTSCGNPPLKQTKNQAAHVKRDVVSSPTAQRPPTTLLQMSDRTQGINRRAFTRPTLLHRVAVRFISGVMLQAVKKHLKKTLRVLIAYVAQETAPTILQSELYQSFVNALFWFFCALVEASIIKEFFDMEVIDESGQKASWTKAFLRALGMQLNILNSFKNPGLESLNLLNLLAPFFTEKQLTLMDLLLDTMVVRKNTSRPQESMPMESNLQYKQSNALSGMGGSR